MKNPWLDLPSKPPYVLPADRLAIDVFNGPGAKRDLKVDTTLLPEPFIGRTDADVVVLALNPGVSAGDRANNRREGFRARLLSCLRQESMRYPFHHLDPAEQGPGSRWWMRTAKALIGATSRELLAERLLCLEYFPYHSKKFGHAHLRLPSQEFTFGLLRQAIGRGAVVLVTRGESIWRGAVPELAAHPFCYRVTNWRAPTISPKNCEDGYSAAVSRLRRPTTADSRRSV